MPDYNFKNNLKSTLQAKLWSDATSIYCNHVVESEDADTRRNAWPAFPFTLTIVDTANDHVEIIKCTSLANNSSDAIVFHCDRAQESTTAQTFEIATTRVEHRLTSEALNSITNAVSPATTTARGIGRVATSADLVDGATINNGPAFLAAGSDALNALVPTFLIGSIISTYAANGYVPNGCVPTDGAEYTASQFPSFYTDYLAAGKMITCTYAEFAAQVALTGNCGKFALDTVNQKFKVPLLKDGDSITQAASSAEIGKSVKAGLPNATGVFRYATTGIGYGAISNTGTVSGAFKKGAARGGAPYGESFPGFDLELDLSGSSPIYRNDVTTVLDEQVRLRHFVVVASAQNNASVFDWSNYMAGLAGKANTALDNLSHAGTNAIAHFSGISDRRINASLPSSGSDTAPAPSNGVYHIYGRSSASGQLVAITHKPSGASWQSWSSGANQDINLIIDVGEGEVCTVYYNTTSNNGLAFVYKKGAY